MGTARDDRRHWEDMYAEQATDEVSWYQAAPTVSLELIASAGAGPSTSVIDVGGGASVLADALVGRGFTDVTVLDVAPGALAAARTRLGSRAGVVDWVEADLLRWAPGRRYDLWHDRAVFHFLTDRTDRDRYRDTLRAALAPGGAVIVGTFAADGPDHCSGLPTSRYDATGLAAEFPGLSLATSRREEHRTPWGAVQPFTWVLLRSSGSGSVGVGC
jgi:SAM-dependent methyltransferase